MECVRCERKINSPKRRTIRELSKRPYLICPDCGKAQPRTGRFNPGPNANPMAAPVHHNFVMGASTVAFNVLVWGPTNVGAGAGVEKRHQIKAAIQGNGHCAFFSEELIFDRGYTVPINVQERAQLHMMDLIVCLGADYGAMQEAQEFANEHPYHFLLWIGEQGKGTYSDEGIGEVLRLSGTSPIFFSDADLHSCIIAIASADWVERWRNRKWAIDDQKRHLDELDPMKRGKQS